MPPSVSNAHSNCADSSPTPGCSWAWCEKLGDNAAAETAYRTALQQDANSTAAWQFLGLLKQEQRDYATAIDCFDEGSQFGRQGCGAAREPGKRSYQLCRSSSPVTAFSKYVTEAVAGQSSSCLRPTRAAASRWPKPLKSENAERNKSSKSLSA